MSSPDTSVGALEHYNMDFVLSTKCRWHAFAAVLLGASVAGTAYAFGIYSEIYKDKLGFSQLDLSIVSSFGSTGLYTGVLWGLFIEAYGPKAVLVLGACLVFSTNFYTYAAVLKTVPHSVPVLSVVNFFAQCGIACTSATVLIVSVRNFPSSVRGQVAGISKAYFGISSATLATFAAGYFEGSSISFILFVAIMLPCIQLFSAVNTNFLPQHLISFDYEIARGRSTSLRPYLIHLVSLFVSILLIGGLHHWGHLSSTMSAVCGSIVALIVITIMALPSLYGPRKVPREDVTHVMLDDADSSHHQFALLHDKVPASSNIEFVSFYNDHIPLTRSLKTWRLYAMMFVFCCVAGSGLLVINNIQAIAEAVDEKPSPYFVTLLAVSNASGRVLVGVIADHVRNYVSRLQILSLVALLMALTHLMLSIGNDVALYPCLLLVGCMFGSTFSNISAITADIYGSKYIGSNYGFIDLAPAAGSYIFSVGLVALFYPESGGDDDDDVCTGARCFRYAFYVTAIACTAASAMAYYVHTKTPINNKYVSVASSEEDSRPESDKF